MKGTKSPLFLYFKMNEKIKDLLEEALAVNESLYLISFEISTNNRIQIVIDGDQGVALSECMRISRNIENNIDREVYDFENTEDLSNKINYLRDNISVAINMGIKIQMKCLSKYNIDIQLDILKEYIKSEYTN